MQFIRVCTLSTYWGKETAKQMLSWKCCCSYRALDITTIKWCHTFALSNVSVSLRIVVVAYRSLLSATNCTLRYVVNMAGEQRDDKWSLGDLRNAFKKGLTLIFQSSGVKAAYINTTRAYAGRRWDKTIIVCILRRDPEPNKQMQQYSIPQPRQPILVVC